MPIIAKTPDGVSHSFPDGTDPALIDGVIKTYLTATQPNPVNIKAAEDAAVQGVADQLGPIDRAAIGARESMRTAASRIPGLVNEQGQQQAQNERDLTSHVGGISALMGRILPGAAATAGVPAGYVPQIAAGTVQGALTGESPLSGALAGAAGGGLGTLAGNLIGRAGNALAGKWAERTIQGTDDTSNALRAFQQEGGKLYPSQASGNKIQQFIDNTAANNILTGGAYKGIANQNSNLLTEAGAAAAGASGMRDIGPTALRAMDDTISKEFNTVADMVPAVPINKDIADEVARLIRPGESKQFAEALKEGTVTGRQYMDIRSKLLGIVRGNSDKVDDAWNLVDNLDEAVGNVAPDGFKGAYAAARERFKNLLTIEKYTRGVSGGQINARTMDSAAEKIFGKTYSRDLPTLLPETKRFHTILRAMADPRMDPLTGGSPTAGRLGNVAAALGALQAYTGGHLPIALAAGGALAGGVPMALAAPAGPLAGQIGGQVGRVSPQLADELLRLNGQQ